MTALRTARGPLARLKDNEQIMGMAKAWAFWTVCFLLWEMVLRLYTCDSAGGAGRLIGAALAAGGILAAVTAIPGWPGKIISWILPWLCYALYGVQMVYFDIFGSFLSLAYVGMGGEAIAAFRSIVLESVWRCLPLLMLMAAPLELYCLQRHLGRLPRRGRAAQVTVMTAGLVIALLTGAGLDVHAETESMDNWVPRYGLLTAEAIDARQTVSGEKGTLLLQGEGTEETYSSEEWNVLPDLDFAALDERTEDETLRGLNAYFSSLEPTPKNEYTGMFRGYNLIYICAEAFSPYLVSEELTPTLYRLSHEGFVFENFYNSFPSLTTNGEYSMCMGLLPDFSRMSFAASADNYEPFCLGTAWKQTGVTPLAYHNNVGRFYNRINTHTNMGFDFKAVGFGLDMEAGSPSSDLEMMEKTVDEYIDQEGFCAYYMTYSGHGPYDFTNNEMSVQNRDLVKDISGSEALRAYYACQLELERALAYLMDRLEQAGIAERTVIVLSADHMPYNLTDEDYAGLAGTAARERFWKYRNSFICWNGGMEEPVVVDDYCCTQDILPTVLNLFGLSYDSRLLTGRDVLAEGEHIAVLKDGSFLTDRVIYDAADGTMTWDRDGDPEPDEEYGEALLRQVKNQFTAAAAILSADYYGFASDLLGVGEQAGGHMTYQIFNDLDGKWYADDVEKLAVNGILSFDGATDFNGERLATRAETVLMLSRGLRLSEGAGEAPYADTPQGMWYSGAVNAMWERGMLPEGEQFRPNERILAVEAREILTRIFERYGIERASYEARSIIRAGQAAQRENSEAEAGCLCRGTVAYIVIRAIELVSLSPDTGASFLD